MWSRVCEYISRHNLLKPNELYIVALSGGADSVTLLLLLREQGYNVHAAHCNFHLRGSESDRDEQFCADLCQRLGVPFHRVHFDTQTYAELHGVSIEMAARTLRYQWFSQLCRDIGAAAVCVAHHRDDSVETVILNMVRGTGLRGLTGIQPRSVLAMDGAGDAELTVLRPLLCVSRHEIEQFLRERGQAYVTDSTNLEPDVLRNKIRLEVLPLLATLNPAVAENILRTSENLAAAQGALDVMMSDSLNGNTLELSRYADFNSREYVAFEWMKQYGFNGCQVRQILEAETGGIVSSSVGFEVLKDRDRLLVEPMLRPMKPLVIPEEGVYRLPEDAVLESGTAVIRLQRREAYVSKLADVATLDAHQVMFPFTLRRTTDGDRMVPYGMKGRKLLSDLMTDRHMTRFEKRRQLVLTDAQGDVVWAVGLRVSQQASVTPSTAEVLEIRFEMR